ncbi:MAG: UspA domain protein [Massilia sp.]|nr:UspA domain protein [Massilia sp.]
MFKHILLPTDGSPASESAIDACIELARQTGASITAIHVMPMLHLYTYEVGVTEAVHQQVRQEGELRSKNYLEQIEQRAAAAGVSCKSMLATADAPYEAIIDAARDGQCDLIAMASHGRKGIKAMLLGSETQKVLTHSAIPVLVFRLPGEPRAHDLSTPGELAAQATVGGL